MFQTPVLFLTTTVTDHSRLNFCKRNFRIQTLHPSPSTPMNAQHARTHKCMVANIDHFDLAVTISSTNGTMSAFCRLSTTIMTVAMGILFGVCGYEGTIQYFRLVAILPNTDNSGLTSPPLQTTAQLIRVFYKRTII